MHFSLWTSFLILFSTPTFAFYPWIIDSSKSTGGTKSHGRRFFPWPNEMEDGQALTLDIKKRPSSVSKRGINDYKVVLADPVTTEGSIAVNEDGSDYSYFATIDFGSSGTPLWLLMDTGGANTWVMGTDCTASPCSTHSTFGSENSTTLDTTTSTWTVTYGSGEVSGALVYDKVAFAGHSVELGFGLASNASDDFNSYPFDGIMGLGRPDSDTISNQTVMQVLTSGNDLKSDIIGVYLQRNSDGERDGEITFGSTDSSKYTGTITYTSTTSDSGLWEISADGCGVSGNSTGLTGRTAIIDTGTSYILMPPSDATALHSQFSTYTTSGEYFQIPCDSTEEVQFTFSGQTYNVSPKDYVGSTTSTSNMCTSNIIGYDTFGDTTWLLGDVFLKNVYTVFDYSENQVGFATAASVSTSVTSTPTPSVETQKTATATATSTSSSGSSSASSSGGAGTTTKKSDASSTSGSSSKSSSASPSEKTGGSSSNSNGMSSGASSLGASSLMTTGLAIGLGMVIGMGCIFS